MQSARDHHQAYNNPLYYPYHRPASAERLLGIRQKLQQQKPSVSSRYLGQCAFATVAPNRKHQSQSGKRLLQRPSERRMGPITAAPALPRCFASHAELAEDDEWVRLNVDLPGVQAKDLDVTIGVRRAGGSNNVAVLSIVGTRKTMSIDGTECIRRDKFDRRYGINVGVVDITAAAISLGNGVLTFRAPKKKKMMMAIRVKKKDAVDVVDRRWLQQERLPVLAEDNGGIGGLGEEQPIRMTTTNLAYQQQKVPTASPSIPVDSWTDNEEHTVVSAESGSTGNGNGNSNSNDNNSRRRRPYKKRAFDSMGDTIENYAIIR